MRDETFEHPPLRAWLSVIFGLLWTAIPVVVLVNGDAPAWQIVLAVAGVLAFGAQFLAVVMTRARALPPVVAMLAITVVLALVTGVEAFAVLFIFAASAVSVRLEGRDSVLAVAAITALAAATLALTDAESDVFWAITGLVLTAGTLWLLISGLLRTNAALRAAREELAELAVAEERLRFARDMHDLLGHDLSLIAIKAELAGKLLPRDADRAASEIGDIRALSRDALVQVRQAVDGYRRPTLASELAGARVALEAAGIELAVEAPDGALEPEVEAVLAWAVREGATNVIRHSGARRATITVTPTTLEIADDGRDATRYDDAARGDSSSGGDDLSGGHGLAGLVERAAAVGGTVEAGAEPGGGFRLRVSVPAREGVAAA